MMITSRKLRSRSCVAGFSLLELSVVIAIISLVAVMGLEVTSIYMGRTAITSTRDKLAVIDQALRNYYRTTGRLPCPALRTEAESYGGATSYGMESCTGATVLYSGSVKTIYSSGGTGCTAGALTFSSGAATATCTVSGGAIASTTVTAGGSYSTVPIPTVTRAGCATAPTLIAGTSIVLAGAIPVVELGLPVSAGIDAYGSKINYVVTQGLTDTRTFAMTPGNIEIRSGKLQQPCSTNCHILAAPAAAPSDFGAAFSIYSNGADKRGSVTRNGARRITTASQNCLSTTTTLYDLAIDSQNCAIVDSATLDTGSIGGTIPGNVIYDSRYNPFLTTESLYFDDLVLWRSKGQL